MKKMLIFSTSLLISISSFSMTMDTDMNECVALPTLQKRAQTAKLQLEDYKNYASSLSKIADSAELLNKTAVAIGVTSAALGIGTATTAVYSVVNGAPILNQVVFNSYNISLDWLFKLTVFKNITTAAIPGVVGGLLGMAITGSNNIRAGTAFILAGGSLGVMLSSPIDTYILGTGIYQLFKGPELLEVKLTDLRFTEDIAKQMLVDNRKKIENILNYSADGAKNSIKLGRPMRIQMKNISNIAQQSVKAAEFIYNSRMLEVSLMSSACAKK